MIKPAVHFVDRQLVNPGNPILINVIGVGGTGSHVLSALADMHTVLIKQGHPGLMVRAYDFDTVADHNCGRQRFSYSEIGYPKAAAKIHRINRSYGLDWKAMLFPFGLKYHQEINRQESAPIVISCVDTVKSRFEIEEMLTQFTFRQGQGFYRHRWTYWMDFGNDRYTGQVQLGTLRDVDQFPGQECASVAALPLFTAEYRTALSKIDDNEVPSCSVEQSLLKQDLFINPTLAMYGARMIYHLLTHQKIGYRAVFINIDTVKAVPVPIETTVVDPDHLQVLQN